MHRDRRARLSGTLESWSSGVLFDNVIIRGNALRFLDRGAEDQGAGWTTANSILWNCESTELQVQSPPGALNQEFGCKGLVVEDSLAYDPRRMPYTDARTMPYRDFFRRYATAPRSLFAAQLTERKGRIPESDASEGLNTSTDGIRELSDEDVPKAPLPPSVHPLAVKDAHFVIDGEDAWRESRDWTWFLGEMAP